MEVRVNGVYHSSIINHLSAIGTSHFSFDLRPMSLNFTQSYKIKEMMEHTSSSLKHFYLHFENEKEFMINEILSDISVARGQSSLMLEFSGKDQLDYYESFKTPYIWHYDEDVTLDAIPNTQYLKKISFDQLFIERLLQFGKLYELFGNIIKLIGNKGVEIEISANWDSAMMETIIDFYPVTSLNFEINNKVERSYRQIDLQLVTGHIEHTKRSLNI